MAPSVGAATGIGGTSAVLPVASAEEAGGSVASGRADVADPTGDAGGGPVAGAETVCTEAAGTEAAGTGTARETGARSVVPGGAALPSTGDASRIEG